MSINRNIPLNVETEIKPSKYFGCEKCDNSGFVSVEIDGYEFKEPCDCYSTFQLNKLKEDSNIPEIYINAAFDLDKSVECKRVFPIGYKKVEMNINGTVKRKRILQFNKKLLKVDMNGFGMQYVNNSAKYLNESPRTKSVGLILSGEVGSGKTYFACAVANEFIKQGFSVCYLKTKQYIDNIIKDSFCNDEGRVKDLKKKRDYLNGFNSNHKDNCHLLILDELGYEYQKNDSGFALAEIKDLLRNRAEKSLPTIITTNFLLNELAEVYEEELMSMFAESYMFFWVICPDDYRIKKSLKLDEDFDFDSIKA